MERTRFCEICAHECGFESDAKKIVQEHNKAVDALTKPIDNKAVLALLSVAHAQIAELREEVRKSSCPYLNDVNPEYTGHNLL